jgi:hypothetical protein
MQRCTIAFVVRVWAEYLSQQPPCWRGVLELCNQGEEIPFTTLEEMMALIQEKTMIHYQMEDEK